MVGDCVHISTCYRYSYSKEKKSYYFLIPKKNLKRWPEKDRYYRNKNNYFLNQFYDFFSAICFNLNSFEHVLLSTKALIFYYYYYFAGGGITVTHFSHLNSTSFCIIFYILPFFFVWKKGNLWYR